MTACRHPHAGLFSGAALKVAATGIGLAGYAWGSHQVASGVWQGLVAALLTLLPFALPAGLLAWHSRWRGLALTACLVACLAFLAGWSQFAPHANLVFLLQGIGINLFLGTMFGRTLTAGQQPLCTTFARLTHPAPGIRVLRYTRQVTWAWTLYFFSYAIVSAGLFLFAPVTVWSAFSNLLSGPLLGLMFAGEYLIRQVVLPATERAGFTDAIRAYQRYRQGLAQPQPDQAVRCPQRP